jgi:hypothetical protein
MPRHTGDRSRPKTEAYPRGTRSPNTVPSSGESACELAGKKAIITHIEEVMAHLLVGWVAAVAGPSAKTERHPSRFG